MPPPEKQQLTINAIARIGGTRKSRLDAWNSSSTGHQVAETRPGTGWRESRATKLQSQLKSGNGSGVRMQDLYGQGAANYDEKLNMIVPKEVRIRAQTTVADMLARPGAMRKTCGPVEESGKSTGGVDNLALGRPYETRGVKSEAVKTELDASSTQGLTQRHATTSSEPRKGIFHGLIVYINGSTQPLISDLKLKTLFAQQGATVSLNLARRRVTHVILGRSGVVGHGAGGGLASTKINKEIQKTAGSSVKYVNVEWVLESLKAGKRLPETRFSAVKVAHQAQKSVYSMFTKSS
ncbi:hypothetical protein BROUX41_006472 [Berkeleyomyces rouxiae]|uniref:uncharacterized protein n=1 Tax=Berkeleyomyces rouxiae TaxID=2035830 RepID=UPI003B7B75F6